MISQHKIPVLEVDLGAGICAFFTTARGGASTPPYSSLNLGDKVGDSQGNVDVNRQLVSHAIGAKVRLLEQVHGCAVQDDDRFSLDGSTHGQTFAESDTLIGDGQVTTRSDLALGVYVADCVPVVLADPIAGVIATAHAGRPGLELKIISKTVDQMIRRGASVSQIKAAVGPCICEACYEVPQQMAQKFVQNTGTEPSVTKWGTTGISLREAAANELESCGVIDIKHIDVCTYERAGIDGEFFSHRWSTKHPTVTGARSGRFAGVVRRLP